ncbi:MAG: DNA recombination protein RmuC [Gammaproteobacteria bacterium AqS3]|nr:DNA recombination protein RmuC [Gammaproteobacteria bacterium AqS3]
MLWILAVLCLLSLVLCAAVIQRSSRLNARNGELERDNGLLRGRLEEKELAQQTLEAQRRALAEEMEAIHLRHLSKTNKDLEERAGKSLQDVLKPYNQRIEDLRKSLESQMQQGSQERTQLKTIITDQLRATADFTAAIKGQAQTRGHFGEVLLARALESVGFVEGRDFEQQVSVMTPDGQRQQIDCVVRLPDERCIIIDAKYPIQTWLDYTASPEADRKVQLDHLLRDLRGYIDGMSKRNYPASLKDSLDFTLLFVPVEAMVATALDSDAGLFAYAWERRVGLVSSTMLLPTLRVVENLWNLDRQQRTQQQLIDAVRRLYDKFASSYDSFAKLGRQLQTAQKSYDTAERQLVSGRGSLSSQFRGLSHYGVQGSKALPGAPDEGDEEDEYVNQGGVPEERAIDAD